MDKYKLELANLKLEVEDGMAIVTLDCKGEGANIFNRAMVQEFTMLLDFLEREKEKLRGLVIQSAKPSVFIAGADIAEICRLTDAKAGEALSSMGQELFERLEKLPFCTVAAIHGAALGGGLECALACDFRVATEDRSTQLGLPETQLGILPAWGGCVRLPRVVGLSRALTLILQGKRLNAKEAKRMGLVEEVVPSREFLLPSAKKLIAEYKPKLVKHVFVTLFNPVILAMAHKKTAKDRRHYPALEEAINTVARGQISRTAGFKAEQKAFGRLASGQIAKNLIRLFYIQERVRKDPGAKALLLPSELFGVCGAGTMGRGIAYALGYAGKEARLHDSRPEALVGALNDIAGLLRERVSSKKLKPNEASLALRRVTATEELATMGRADFVIEAITENLEAKQRLFKELSEIVGKETVLATNTSTLLPSLIAKDVKNPANVVGMHFFNPVHQMKLVEVVVTPATDPRVLATTVQVVKTLGKTPIVVKECPGFLVNRVLGRYLSRAGELVLGGASPELVDKALVEWGMPMGPFELLDLIGFDVACDVASVLHEAFADRFASPILLKTLLGKDFMGAKNGNGFYAVLSGSKQRANKRFNPDVKLLMRVIAGRAETKSRSDFAKILISEMADEARRCVREGIVKTEEEVDLALILGIGFPPFRGSIFNY